MSKSHIVFTVYIYIYCLLCSAELIFAVKCKVTIIGQKIYKNS